MSADADRIDVLERRLERERLARVEAEQIAERATRELHQKLESWVHTAHDLAEANARLTATEERFRSLVANIPQAVYSGTRLGEPPDLLSDAILAISGYPPEEFIGRRPLTSLVHPDDADAYLIAVEESLREGTPLAADYRIVHADGSVRWVHEQARASLDAEGMDLVNGAITDMTERVLAQSERDRIEAELRVAQKLESVGQLAAGIAHEINTPIQFVADSVHFLGSACDDLLGVIAAYREIVAETATDALVRRAAEAEDDADVEYLEERLPAAAGRASEGIERVSTIVKAMKAFSHADLVQAMAPADLNAALETTLVVARHEYKYAADVVLELGELPPVTCSVGELNQVFLNLVVNAAHAIEDARGGEGWRGTIRVSTVLEGGDVVVRVSDDGAGIAPDVQQRIFDPFFTTKEIGRGSGQGLAISRSVVDRHGGSLTFETTVGVGTTFVVRLPVAGAATTEPILEEAA